MQSRKTPNADSFYTVWNKQSSFCCERYSDEEALNCYGDILLDLFLRKDHFSKFYFVAVICLY